MSGARVRLLAAGFLLALTLAWAPAQALMPAPVQSAGEAWWRHPAGPAYQVLVYAYADSNGDGTGDLAGLTARLDAIQALGATAIWLSPIHPAASYHGYDVIDYRGIDPRLGSMADFRELVAQAHRRGIKILLDMVFNHSSSEHPWFKSFLAQPAGPYADWYITRQAGVGYGAATMGGWVSRPRPGGGRAEYYASFWIDMPDLNLANPAVRAECRDILAFWLGEGADGFRFDAAKEIFNTGKVAQGTSVIARTREFWNQLRDAARAVKPDVFFVAEVNTTSAIEIAAYAQCFDSLFDFVTAKALTELPAAGLDTGFVDKYLAALKLYRRVAGFVPAPFLSNHDQDRVATLDLNRFGASAIAGFAAGPDDGAEARAALQSSQDRNRVQALIYLAMPGLPFIYYGEELGMTGRRYKNDDIARRDAYPWGGSLDGLTTKWQSRSGMTEKGQNARTPPWSVQSGEPDSLLGLYEALGRLRRAWPALQGDAVTAVDWPGFNAGTVVSFWRGLGADRLLVVANLGTGEVRLALPPGLAWTGLLDTGRSVAVADGVLVLPPATAAVGRL